MTEERSEAEREAARRAGRGTLSHVDEHALEASADSRESPAEDPRSLRQDGQKKGSATGG
ncbi:MAG TPA: hypothetical protein VGA38_11520 [Candidatus Limnocylindria bacterium]